MRTFGMMATLRCRAVQWQPTTGQINGNRPNRRVDNGWMEGMMDIHMKELVRRRWTPKQINNENNRQLCHNNIYGNIGRLTIPLIRHSKHNAITRNFFIGGRTDHFSNILTDREFRLVVTYLQFSIHTSFLSYVRSTYDVIDFPNFIFTF